jgi:alpha-glucosidase
MPWKQREPHAGFSTVRPWLPVSDSHTKLAVDAQELDESSTLSLTRQLVRFRKEQPALRFGSMRIIEASTAVLIFERTFEAERLLCAFNLSTEASDFQPTASDAWRTVQTVGGAQLGYLPPLSGLIAARVRSD